MSIKISEGVSSVHKIASDLKNALLTDSRALEKWEEITPLARNEWICWVTHVKKAETRKEHIKRMMAELKEGVRRPCCWPGCPHRNPAAKKWFERKSVAYQK